MSFIQETYECVNCGEFVNLALGTFGYGVPTECTRCGKNPATWQKVKSGWHAEEMNKTGRDMQVSVIISARDEFPNIVHTVHSIVNDLETFLRPSEFEIIIVDNGSRDKDSWRFLQERGMFFHRNLRVLHDPIMGNVTARNKGAKIAKGKYIFFSDAHMSYKIGSFKKMVDAIDETGGIVHPAVQWMGGYHPSDPSYQYTIKLGEKIWGTWNRALVSETEPFYIPVCGHCCLGMEREQFLKFGGYNDYFRCYGGGEVYLDIKWWMLGSCVSSVPTAVGYHLSAGRGYSFTQDDLIHNMMLLGLALGADAMAERVYIRYLGKDGVDKAKLLKMYEEAKIEASKDRQDLLPRVKQSFMDIIAGKPWDIENEKKHGKHASLIGVYDETWTSKLEGEAKTFYESSPLQAELKEFIAKHLAEYVYKAE